MRIMSLAWKLLQSSKLIHIKTEFILRSRFSYITGAVTPVIDRCFPLKETAEAMRYFGEGNVKGKVVISMVR
jgi:NADPH:quinone reductase-like Zn-dependent oxidoreductase